MCGVLNEKCAPHRLGRLNSCSQFGGVVWGGSTSLRWASGVHGFALLLCCPLCLVPAVEE